MNKLCNIIVFSLTTRSRCGSLIRGWVPKTETLRVILPSLPVVFSSSYPLFLTQCFSRTFHPSLYDTGSLTYPTCLLLWSGLPVFLIVPRFSPYITLFHSLFIFVFLIRSQAGHLQSLDFRSIWFISRQKFISVWCVVIRISNPSLLSRCYCYPCLDFFFFTRITLS